MLDPTISSWQAFILGAVEGITEYLPVSSTGHLVITSDLLGLADASRYSEDQLNAIKSFEIVIQSGAILAVFIIYWKYVYDMILGILGRSRQGLKLFINILIATFPILFFGFLLHKIINTYLQSTLPVLIALVVGGIGMILYERYYGKKSENNLVTDIYDLTWKQALFIGAVQCIAMWPGTSRSMVTIIAALIVGLNRAKAAEFSFIIGLPALLAATGYKAMSDGSLLLAHVGISSLLVGLITATVFAMIAVKWLVAFLNRHGLSLFGWYRLGLALTVFLILGI